MFRELKRKKQQLSREECIDILKTELRGVLSLQGDDGYPYGVPINYWYCEEDGKLYFHSGKTGYKVDAVRACDKVSFCVCDQGVRQEGEWWFTIRSVIIFGRIQIVEDHEKTIWASRQLSLKFTSDTDYIEDEIRRVGAHTLCFELTPEHMTGKVVTES